MNIKVIKRIHELIEIQSTGSPKELAERLGLTERSIYKYIAFMKNELKASIKFDYAINQYIYEKECGLNFEGKI